MSYATSSPLEHSILDPVGQSRERTNSTILSGSSHAAPVAGEHVDASVKRAPSAARNRLLDRYGPDLLSQGYTALPNLVSKHYAALVNEAEFVLIQQLWTFWWDIGEPSPSVGTLAERMDKTPRQVQHYIERLRDAGLLTVIERRDGRGAQLPNRYDLRPFLRAVEARARESIAARESGVHAAAPPEPTATRPVQPSAPPPLQLPSSKENPVTQNLLDLDSTPSARAQQKPAPIDDIQAARSVLAASFATISHALGDEAPNASLTRACRLLDQHALTPDAFLRAVREAQERAETYRHTIAKRRADRKPNAMPYLFATLEKMLRPGPPPLRAGTYRLPRTGARKVAAPREPSFRYGQQVDLPADLHPIWRAVLAELKETLPVATFQSRLLPTRVVRCDDATLWVEAPDAFTSCWLDRMLATRIQAVLAARNQPDIRVVFVPREGGTST